MFSKEKSEVLAYRTFNTGEKDQQNTCQNAFYLFYTYQFKNLLYHNLCWIYDSVWT